MRKEKILLTFFIGIFLLNQYVFAQKNDNPVEAWQEEEGVLEDYQLIQTDTIPGLEFELSEEDALTGVIPKKQSTKSKKAKKKFYKGIKTKRGLVRQSAETVIEFRFPKEYKEPIDDYAQEVFYYDLRGKDIHSATYEVYMDKLRKGYNFVLLHGAYTKFLNRQIVEEGNFYLGTKNGRWQTYDREGILLEKLVYNQGWLSDSRITTYGGSRLQEVVPIVNEEVHGKYYAFHENGQISAVGEYQYGEKVGIWYEFYGNGKKKRMVQYKKYFYEQDEPFVRNEWNAQGKETFDYKKHGKKPPE